MSETEQISLDDQGVIDAEEVEFISNDIDDGGPEMPDDDEEPATVGQPVFAATAPAPEPAAQDLGAEAAFSEFVNSIPNNEAAVIVVSRFADRNLRGQFRVPCDAFGRTGIYTWEDDMEDIIRQIQSGPGGGHYQLQLRIEAGPGQTGRGGFRGSPCRMIIHDPATPSEAERLRAKDAEPKSEAVRSEQPAPAAVVAPPPVEKARTLAEQISDMKEIFEIMSPVFAPPVPVQAAPAHVPLKEQIAEQVLQSIVTSANNGDGDAKRMISRIAENALGLNQPEPEPAAETIGGAVAGIISDPSKLKAWGDTAKELIGDFGPMLMAALPKPPAPAQNAAPASNVRGIDRWRKAPDASPETAAPARESAPAAAPDLKLVPEAAPAGEAPPAASSAPKKRVKMVRW